MPTIDDDRTSSFDEADFHEKLARRLHEQACALLEQRRRTASEVDRMIHAAHAARLHWELAGSARQCAAGECQISRVYCELGRIEPALHHARRCLELCREHGLSPFCSACGHVAIARALTVRKDPTARQHLAEARDIGSTLEDPEERRQLDLHIGELEDIGASGHHDLT